MNPSLPRVCLVLGGKGFVGSAIVAEAQSRGYRTVVVDKEEYAAAVETSCDLLINANGNSKKFLAAQDPQLDFDLSVRSVLHSLRDFHIQRYIHLSTGDVYAEHSDPTRNAETAEIEVVRLSAYGFHKYLAEQLVRFYAPSWLLFRMGGFVGPRLWKNSIHDLLTHQPLHVHPDSTYQYLHTRDMARIVLDVAEAGVEREIFNVTGGGAISLRTIAQWISDRPCPPAWETLPREHYEMSVKKISARCALPDTATTVHRFVQQALAGQEAIG